MGVPNERINRSFNFEDYSGAKIGFNLGSPAGVEVPLLSTMISIASDGIKDAVVIPLNKTYLMSRVTFREISAITAGTAKFKVGITPTGTAMASRVFLNTTEADDVNSDTLSYTSNITVDPLLPAGSTITVEVTDGDGSETGTVAVTVWAVEINEEDSTSFD